MKWEPRAGSQVRARLVFREAVKNGILHITRVETKKQLADIFTKPTPLTTLEPLRKEIMGWLTMFKRGSNESSDKHKVVCRLTSIKQLTLISEGVSV